MPALTRRETAGAGGAAAGTAGKPIMLFTVAAPVDEVAAAFAIETAVQTGCTLIVCEAVLVTIDPGNLRPRTAGDHAESCAAVARRACAAGATAEVAFFNNPRPVRAAIVAAKDYEIGLLIFGPDPSYLSRFRYRRWRRQVQRDAPCLVWLPESA